MFARKLTTTTLLAAGLACAPLAAQAQWGGTTHSNSTTDSKTTGSSQSTTTTQTRQGAWGNNTVTETTSQTTGTSNSRTKSTTRGTSVTTPTWNGNSGWGRNNSGWNGANRNNNNNDGDAAAAVGAILGVLGALAGDSASDGGRIQPEDAYGPWVASSRGPAGYRTCNVQLSADDAFMKQGYKLKTERCWNSPFSQTYAWRPHDGGILLVRTGGGTLALMRGDPNRLTGRTEDGSELVLHRPGY